MLTGEQEMVNLIPLVLWKNIASKVTIVFSVRRCIIRILDIDFILAGGLLVQYVPITVSSFSLI